MLMNNNQKVPSAATRLAKLPIVRSACTKLLVLYTDTKRGHPNLKSVCDGVEDSVTALGAAACDRFSPVIVKLEPQISIANGVACKSLDWLETTFPLLQAPTEQVVATAKNKMHEIQDAVTIAANGTMDCVQHTVTWVMERMQQADEGTNQSLVERVISVASVGLDCALSVSEAMVDQVLPLTEEDKDDDTHMVESFEAATVRRYPVRLISLTAKLCRRTYHMVVAKMQSVQATKTLPWSASLIQDLQSTSLVLVWSIQGLPQYLQHQLVSVFFSISQMYNVNHTPPEQSRRSQAGHYNTSRTSSYKGVVQGHPQAVPTWRLRPTKSSVFDKGCMRR
uniref:Perilipin n=2 Tax=Monopterus albus TaxID=43700 RepID=A0A3Q3IWC3_MONAL|nr:perilipin-2 isoform X2 [Monopterus albus]